MENRDVREAADAAEFGAALAGAALDRLSVESMDRVFYRKLRQHSLHAIAKNVFILAVSCRGSAGEPHRALYKPRDGRIAHRIRHGRLDLQPCCSHIARRPGAAEIR